MPMFLVEHEHSDATCPAQSPESAKMMESLVLGTERQRECGVKLVEDCKVRGEHRLLILLDAPERSNAEKYAAPFKQVGKTEVRDLTTCSEFLQNVLSGEVKGCR